MERRRGKEQQPVAWRVEKFIFYIYHASWGVSYFEEGKFSLISCEHRKNSDELDSQTSIIQLTFIISNFFISLI